ncbi:hypothetical protein DXZ75_09785 [Streptomyces sp. AcE210]|nr:hypothetical protein DXZ75_09785 [Streptomyces sp. AcE210]
MGDALQDLDHVVRIHLLVFTAVDELQGIEQSLGDLRQIRRLLKHGEGKRWWHWEEGCVAAAWLSLCNPAHVLSGCWSQPIRRCST